MQAVDDDGNSTAQATQKPKPVMDEAQFENAKAAVKAGKYTISKIKEHYTLTPEQEAQL